MGLGKPVQEEPPPEIPPFVEDPPALKRCKARLLGDTDRSDEPGPGRITNADEEAKHRWTWGDDGRGAICIFNCDEDVPKTTRDFLDASIPNSDDLRELVPLRIEAWASFPRGWSAVLRVSRPFVNIFDGYQPRANRIIHARKLEYEIPSLRTPLVYGMEANRFPYDKNDKPEFDVELLIYRDADARQRDEPECGDRVRFRIAPWMMVWNGQPTKRVFVADAAGRNSELVRGLRAELEAGRATGSVVVAHPIYEFSRPDSTASDQWVQDWMQLGETHIRNHRIPVVLDSVRAAKHRRDNKSFPQRQLQAVDFGRQDPHPVSFESASVMGNVEVTPPVVTGQRPNAQEWPFGRIFFGSEMSPTLKEFFRAQLVQGPFEIDVSWLQIGHVDEVACFVATGSSLSGGTLAGLDRGWRLLMPSPRLAIRALNDLRQRGLGDWTLLRDREDASGNKLQRSVNDVLNSAEIVKANHDAQRKLDAVALTMSKEVGVYPWEIVGLPVLFQSGSDGMTALTANLVNGIPLVASGRSHFFAQKPAGPEIPGGGDYFELMMRAQLGFLGINLVIVDVWDMYHAMLGELHCATAVERVQRRDRLWWQMKEPKPT